MNDPHKILVLKSLPCLILLAAVISYLIPGPVSEAEGWLRAQSPNVKHIDVSYGSAWRGSVWKYISIHDHDSIQRLIASVKCKGSLTKNNQIGNATSEELNGYNGCYYILLTFKDNKKKPEQLVIHPSSTYSGANLLLRYGDNPQEFGIVGTAVMTDRQFEGFKKTLQTVFGRRRADRH